MDRLDITKVFTYVCNDCIGIIMDYIDSPHDILKLIYYNKYYLYNTNENRINKTSDSVQLLLYEKFYEKVMINMEEYVNRSDANWTHILKLLNETTILSGGYVLQSIYGKINETTEIPLDFYYKEYMEIYPDISLCSLKSFIKKYRTKKTTIVCTDLDIFKVTPIDIFSSNGIIEFHVNSHADIYYELYHTRHNTYIILININGTQCESKNDDYYETYDDLKNEEHFNEYKYSDKFIHVIKNEKCDIYIEKNINVHKKVSILDCTFEHYDNILSDEQRKYYKIKYYKILDNSILHNRPITNNNIMNIIRSTPESIQEIFSIPTITENCKIAHSDGCYSIKEYLVSSGDSLLKEIENIHSNTKNRVYCGPCSSDKTSYDSLEDKYRSYNNFDSYSHYKNVLPISDDGHDYAYRIMFNSEMEKKIIPVTHSIGNKLLLNLIYINPHFFTNSKNFIDQDFDINICKQSFDGKKIKLHSIGDLVHKRFRYDIYHIINNNNNNNTNKYICFRKRIEKYKMRGFTCLDEKQVIGQVKDLLEIRYTDRAMQTIRENNKSCNALKKYYNDIVQQNDTQYEDNTSVSTKESSNTKIYKQNKSKKYSESDGESEEETIVQTKISPKASTQSKI